MSRFTQNLVAGTTYIVVVSSHSTGLTGTFELYASADVDVFPATIKANWYTTDTGGSPIFVGQVLNPVGLAGSGITDTATVGTTTFYVALSTNTDCRTPVTFTVTPSTDNVTTVTSSCSYTWSENNQTYTESGIYTGSTYDCVIEKLHLTINSTTWNGTAWSNGNPDATKGVVFAGNFTATSSISACNIEVTGNAVVIVPSGINFIVTGKVTVAATASLTFENNANLVQLNNTTNSGNITCKRNSAALMRFDYTLWSSPVASQQLQSFSAATLANCFFTYDPLIDLYKSKTPTENFATGAGYLIRMPNNHPTTPTIWSGSFTGIPNNGNITISVPDNSYNAIGNPYPSTISADAFIDDNSLSEALYFWRKTNNAAYTSYATYTKAGGTANAGGLSTIVPNGTIQVGQGFIAKSTNTTFSFTNSLRTSNNANQFLKTKAIEKHRIWLNLSKSTEPVNQMMIAYINGATSRIDPTLDGRFINDSPIALNSIINNEEFIIQAKGLPFDDSDIVPLTFKTNSDGNYTISIDHVDGLFLGNQNIFLKDNLIGLTHDLKENNYSFTSSTGTFNDRFELVYKNSGTLGTDVSELEANKILVYKQNGVLNINAGTKVMKTIRVFDIQGRLIFKQEKVNQSATILKNFTAAEQTILVQITTDNDKIVTKKVIY